MLEVSESLAGQFDGEANFIFFIVGAAILCKMDVTALPAF